MSTKVPVKNFTKMYIELKNKHILVKVKIKKKNTERYLYMNI